MKKTQIFLIAGGVVSAVVLVAVAALTVTAAGASGDAKQKMNRDFKKLKSYYAENPYPNAENLATAEENLKKAEADVKGLAKLLAKGSLDYESRKGIMPGEFSRRREETINKLIADAPKNQNNEPVVAADFLFGFDRFANGVPAEKKDVPRLTCQLELVDKIVRMLYDAEIQSLEGVAREEFDAETHGDASGEETSSRVRRSVRGDRNRANRGAVPKISVPVTPFEGSPVALERNRFGFQFTAREDAVEKILHSLEEMRPYAMVSGFSMKKIGDDVVFPDEAVKEKSGTSTRASAESAAPIPGIKEKPAPRTTRVVSGPLREKSVRVTMYVDVYSVPSSSESAEEKASAEEI